MLVRVEKEDFHLVAPLFSGFRVHRGHFGSVLAGARPGRVFVDDPRLPKAAVIWPEDGFQYLACSGGLERFVEDCRALLAASGAACLELVADEPELESRIADIFGAPGWFAVPRVLYRLPRGAAPAGSSGPPAPGALLSRSRGPAALRVSLGLEGREAGYCEGWIYGEEAEIDAWVEEASRGRGWGAALGRELLAYCRDEGLVPRWSCWADKPESRRLALALGFEEEREVMVYVLDLEA